MTNRSVLICPRTWVHIGEPSAPEAYCSCDISPPPLEPPRILSTENQAICSFCSALLASATQGEGAADRRA